MRTDEPRVTLIVPAYRVEKYLRACLDSIAAQTDGRLEAIVVDDGSPDRSAEIAERFAAADPRFRVLRQPNGGASVARNAGLQQARGEWVWFVDGDDLIAPDALQTLLPHATPATDMLLFDYVAYGKQDDAPHTGAAVSVPSLPALRLKNVAQLRPGEAGGLSVRSASFCLYRRAFLLGNELRFDPAIRKGQDALFNFRALSKAKTALYIAAPLYWYRRNEGSVSVRYSPDAARLCEALNGAYRDAIRELYGDDDAMLRRMNLRAFRSVRIALNLGLCNARNERPYRERKSAYRRMLDTPDMRAALSALRRERLSLPERGMLLLMRGGRFFALNALYRTYTRLS